MKFPTEPKNVIGHIDGCPAFTKGNKLAKKENLSPEAHKKRMDALRRGWDTNRKVDTGEMKVTETKDGKRIAKKRERARLQKTISRTHRETQEKARQMTDAIMERFFKIATESLNETAVIAAGNAILDRGYGKANQTHINASVDANGTKEDVSGKELDTRIEETLGRIRELAGREEKPTEGQERPADLRKIDRDPDSSTKH